MSSWRTVVALAGMISQTSRRPREVGGGKRDAARTWTWLACLVAEFARIRAICEAIGHSPEVLATSATSKTCASVHWYARQVRVHGRAASRRSHVPRGTTPDESS